MRILGVCLPNSLDTVSYYRGLGPLGTMAKGSDIIIHQVESFNWASLRQLSCLFMQRPYNNNHMDIFEEAKINNVPVWVDYDDLLTEMPMSNPAWFQYEKTNVKKNIEKIIEYADVVTVSTRFLGGKFIHLNKNIVVLPNACDLKMFPYREKDAGERAKAFYWRGSNTHHKDVWSYADEIVASAEEFSEWKYHFLADNLWFLTERMKDDQCYVMEAQKIESYYAHIWRIAPSACMVPLHECSFNRSKSNIAYIEAAFAGAVTIAPDWEEWRNPGTLVYNDKKSFYEAIRAVGKGQVDVKKMGQQAWEYVSESLSLEKINVKRRQVFERLTM